MKKIVFTGGGTAGHVTPNLALISRLRGRGWEIDYIGSNDGIEKRLVEQAGIRFHPIAAGKLRRYFDWRNFKDPFNVLRGIVQAHRLLRRLKPDVVFSKGGFVSVPVVIAGWLNKIPVIIHESDMTPGLANKLSIPFATKVCVTFPETMRYLNKDKAVFTGLPIRSEMFAGRAENGFALCGFQRGKPVLLAMGGSLGAKTINDAIRGNLRRLLERFQIVHLCGKGNVDPAYASTKGYKQFEYVTDELPDLLAMADVVVSRAGSTAIFECLALRKPMLLIPLSRQASRGDQILNAESFRERGFCLVLEEERLDEQSFVAQVDRLYKERETFAARMREEAGADGADAIVALIEKMSRRS